uniref:NADH-ubiquinone oxidoreductase chain 6 n=1 Tax=Sundasalanx sp. Chao Phraya TaxID=689625 RepID=H1UC27_9TELE|nr:NADH dehydrogenase subunit 6 [Sundasalanx sp. Chao Phraya]BAL43698.1 NADH dehydrogenase subunit 6 [Sundasalanx sp. Chao Phraya]
MLFFAFMYLVGFVLGMMGVASNPSPYYAALGLVLCSGSACAFLAVCGSGFLALALFLIYLGGMLVVFGYTTALAADPHPQTWGDVSVLEQFVLCFMVVLVGFLYVAPLVVDWTGGVLSGCKELLMVRAEVGGVAMLYSVVGPVLLLCAWALLLTLFVVLELTRGHNRGPLRAV